MSIFDAYDTEFASLKQEIAKNIDEYKNCADNNEKSASVLRLIDGLFMQANDLIKQMEIEARSSDSSSRKLLNDKVLQYKKSISQLKGDSSHITAQYEKASLMSVSKSGEQRQRLLDTNDRFQLWNWGIRWTLTFKIFTKHRIGRQNEMISNAHRSVLESEEVGMEITSELARNREKIESSRAKVA